MNKRRHHHSNRDPGSSLENNSAKPDVENALLKKLPSLRRIKSDPISPSDEEKLPQEKNEPLTDEETKQLMQLREEILKEANILMKMPVVPPEVPDLDTIITKINDPLLKEKMQLFKETSIKYPHLNQIQKMTIGYFIGTASPARLHHFRQKSIIEPIDSYVLGTTGRVIENDKKYLEFLTRIMAMSGFHNDLMKVKSIQIKLYLDYNEEILLHFLQNDLELFKGWNCRCEDKEKVDKKSLTNFLQKKIKKVLKNKNKNKSKIQRKKVKLTNTFATQIFLDQVSENLENVHAICSGVEKLTKFVKNTQTVLHDSPWHNKLHTLLIDKGYGEKINKFETRLQAVEAIDSLLDGNINWKDFESLLKEVANEVPRYEPHVKIIIEMKGVYDHFKLAKTSKDTGEIFGHLLIAGGHTVAGFSIALEANKLDPASKTLGKTLGYLSKGVKLVGQEIISSDKIKENIDFEIIARFNNTPLKEGEHSFPVFSNSDFETDESPVAFRTAPHSMEDIYLEKRNKINEAIDKAVKYKEELMKKNPLSANLLDGFKHAGENISRSMANGQMPLGIDDFQESNSNVWGNKDSNSNSHEMPGKLPFSSENFNFIKNQKFIDDKTMENTRNIKFPVKFTTENKVLSDVLKNSSKMKLTNFNMFNNNNKNE
jgi:hypothetical protein